MKTFTSTLQWCLREVLNQNTTPSAKTLAGTQALIVLLEPKRTRPECIVPERTEKHRVFRERHPGTVPCERSLCLIT